MSVVLAVFYTQEGGWLCGWRSEQRGDDRKIGLIHLAKMGQLGLWESIDSLYL